MNSSSKVIPVVKVEYICIDGQRPTGKLRSKTKILKRDRVDDISQIPNWSIDGSSTEQAEGNFSDIILKPVYMCPDPIRKGNHKLVLCEVLNLDGSNHVTNSRAGLRMAMEIYEESQGPMVGIEQEYTLYGRKNHPLGWPDGGFPSPQGRYYCGVGLDEVHGRHLIEVHLDACIDAGLSIAGINAEVMPAQWEFQIGMLDPLEASDQIWIARWLLYRLGEDFGAYAKLDPKPMSGDWNGAGSHINFSTREMREKKDKELIISACKRLEQQTEQHIKIYGADNDKRLTGKHETCSIHQFRYGVSDRGASVRIPSPPKERSHEYTYLEDRRPAANVDPYKACTALLETICGDGFNPHKYGWVDEDYKFI